MGAIEDIYRDLDADVSEAEFREAVEQKVEQMEGLADEETAAMIVAHELADGEVETVADIEPGMDEVKFLAKVLSIGETRTFDREDGEGTVVNVEAGDETGTVRLAFWDGRAKAVAEGEIEPGTVLRIKGRPEDGYRGLEVSVEEAQQEADVDIDVTPGEEATIDSLTLGQSDVTLAGVVLATEPVRTFDRDDGSEGQVANLALGDETGRVRVTLWDEQATRVEELEPGTAVELVDGYVRERGGDLEVHLGEESGIDPVEETIAYEPDATPIEAVEIGETVDLAGVVRSTDPKRTFDRDDGSQGQVRNVRLQDGTDDIRIALWGDLADLDIAPGDELLAADVEIEDGWQDDLEASANWQSTVAVLEDADISPDGMDVSRDAEPNRGGDETGGAVSDGGDSAGLDAFADGETPETSATVESGNRIEFTGTVVQTGQPVVLDDGTETMSVETDATVRLGEELTVRGELVGDCLDADEVI